jgi:hypothetical protein
MGLISSKYKQQSLGLVTNWVSCDQTNEDGCFYIGGYFHKRCTTNNIYLLIQIDKDQRKMIKQFIRSHNGQCGSWNNGKLLIRVPNELNENKLIKNMSSRSPLVCKIGAKMGVSNYYYFGLENVGSYHNFPSHQQLNTSSL